LSRNPQVIEESPKVPAYIVTFSDMITLLLTFFVMLLSLAEVQDPELFNTGRDSFIKSINMFGLGTLQGKTRSLGFGEIKTKYFIREPEKSLVVRTIDAKEEEIRRLFKKLTRSMTTMPSQIVAETANFSVTNIRFSPGQAVLNESARNYLAQFALNLQSSPAKEKIRLYVLGLAAEPAGGGTKKDSWLLSARRAKVVADYLNESLTSDLRWPVYSWGAGPGGDWVNAESPISEESHILIASLRSDE